MRNLTALPIPKSIHDIYIRDIDIIYKDCMLVINHLESTVTNTYMCYFIIVTLNKNLYVVIHKCFLFVVS